MNFQYRKSSQAKKIKSVTKSEEDLRSQKINVLHSFRFSIPLFNLLRDPSTDGQQFDLAYLTQLASELRAINPAEECDYDDIVLYLHLILAQVDNLYEMEELGREGGQLARLNTDKWNHTNILNPKSILASLNHHCLLPSAPLPTHTQQLQPNHLEEALT